MARQKQFPGVSTIHVSFTMLGALSGAVGLTVMSWKEWPLGPGLACLPTSSKAMVSGSELLLTGTPGVHIIVKETRDRNKGLLEKTAQKSFYHWKAP